MADQKDSVYITVELDGAGAREESGDIGVRTRHRKPEKAKFDVQVIEGDDWTADRGRFAMKLQVIDRLNDWYLEVVVDKETGDVLHYCSEPLSDHTGAASD